MKAFKRYLLHFSAIGLVVFILGLIAIHDDKQLFSIKFIPFFVMAILIYVFPMSFIFSKLTEKYSFKIENSSPELMIKLDRLFLEPVNQKRVKRTDNGVIYYSYKNKYSSWLAGDISVTQYDDYTVVNAPKRYAKALKSL